MQRTYQKDILTSFVNHSRVIVRSSGHFNTVISIRQNKAEREHPKAAETDARVLNMPETSKDNFIRM